MNNLETFVTIKQPWRLMHGLGKFRFSRCCSHPPTRKLLSEEELLCRYLHARTDLVPLGFWRLGCTLVYSPLAVGASKETLNVTHQEHDHLRSLAVKRTSNHWATGRSNLSTGECERISDDDFTFVLLAGHPKHENTSWSSFGSIFKFLRDRYLQRTPSGKEEL